MVEVGGFDTFANVAFLLPISLGIIIARLRGVPCQICGFLKKHHPCQFAINYSNII